MKGENRLAYYNGYLKFILFVLAFQQNGKKWPDCFL